MQSTLVRIRQNKLSSVPCLAVTTRRETSNHYFLRKKKYIYMERERERERERTNGNAYSIMIMYFNIQGIYSDLGEPHKVIKCVLLKHFRKHLEDDSAEEGKE
jgi:hypothetical protein